MKYEDASWMAYQRKDGRKGIRNHLLVIYTVECASFVAEKITARLDNLQVECIGFRGCTDNAYAERLLLAMIHHPNVGGVLAVGLGCEYIQPKMLAEAGSSAGKPCDWFYIQEQGGTSSSIEHGVAVAQSLLRKMDEQAEKVPMNWSELVVGAECGGSDYTSGLCGNVVVGQFFDRLVERDGTAIFEEIVEAVGLVESLSARGSTPEICEKIRDTYDKALEYCKSVQQFSVSPGNFAGGLSTIEEKSMGALIKSGTKPIQDVLKVSELPPSKGLFLLDSTPDPHFMQFGITNPNDNEGLMDLLASGSHILFLVTGRGNVVGSAVSPVIKITGNSDTFTQMKEDMDFDAGQILAGLCDMTELTDQLEQLVLDVVGGIPSKSEKLGHKEYYIPYKYQDVPCCGEKRPTF